MGHRAVARGGDAHPAGLRRRRSPGARRRRARAPGRAPAVPDRGPAGGRAAGRRPRAVAQLRPRRGRRHRCPGAARGRSPPRCCAAAAARRAARVWARIGLETLRSLESDPRTGIRSRSGRQLSRVPEDPPEWADLLDDLRLCFGRRSAAGLRVRLALHQAPVVGVPVYVAYLQARFERTGGTIEVNPVTSLAEVTDGSTGAAPVVVELPGRRRPRAGPGPGRQRDPRAAW